MGWERKAALQRAVAGIPLLSEPVYYGLQRTVGALNRRLDALTYFKSARTIITRLREGGIPLRGATAFEVGTGRTIFVPLALYLAGVERTYTYDLHRYLRPRLVMESLGALRLHRDRIEGTMSGIAPAHEIELRISRLLRCRTFAQVCDVAGIEYAAPADASRTKLPDRSIDIHYSHDVFEHIPAAPLLDIMREAGRVLRPNGVTAHLIDLTDHFEHGDASIPPINFLRYSDDEWDRLAGNQFAYVNRFRPQDYADIFEAAGQHVIDYGPRTDPRSVAALRDGFPVHRNFAHHPVEDLAVSHMLVVSRTANVECYSGELTVRRTVTSA